MNDLRIPRIVYGFLLAIGVLDWVRRYPLLPARMLSHGQFDIRATLAVLFGFVAFTGIWTTLLLRHFNRIPETAFPGKQKES